MVIDNFNEENVGTYICKANNNKGEASKNVPISIKIAPTVTVVPDKLTLKAGEKGFLKCNISGTHGDFKIRWIDESAIEKISVNFTYFDKSFNLKFFFMQHNDRYEFNTTRHHHNQRISCEVVDGDFTVTSYSTITVQYGPEFDAGVNDGVISKKVKHGSDSKLDCESHENPKATAEWFFNKVALNHNEKSWKILNMKSSKAGLYHCLIQNSVGNATKYFNVIETANSKFITIKPFIEDVHGTISFSIS